MKNLLCVVPIFAGLEEESLEILLEHAHKAGFPDGAVIAREGETNNSMYLIESGQVRIVKNLESSAAVMLAVLGAGEFFGEMCILETLPRSATAQAVGRTTVVNITSTAILHLYNKAPAQYGIILLNIARDLSRRLRRLDERFAACH